jgi:hypothetical protein
MSADAGEDTGSCSCRGCHSTQTLPAAGVSLFQQQHNRRRPSSAPAAPHKLSTPLHAQAELRGPAHITSHSNTKQTGEATANVYIATGAQLLLQPSLLQLCWHAPLVQQPILTSDSFCRSPPEHSPVTTMTSSFVS